MLNYEALLPDGEFQIPTLKKITRSNLNPNILILAAETHLHHLTHHEFQDEKNRQRRFDATVKAVNVVLEKMSFSAYAHANPLLLGSLLIVSNTRPIIYDVQDGNCQCEGFENHGHCYHLELRPVFQIYLSIFRAHEALQRSLATLGIQLKHIDENNAPPQNTPAQRELRRFLDEELKRPIGGRGN